MDVVKHPRQVKAFNRKNIMDVAKTIRNCHITQASREIVVRALANYFEREDQFFDRNMFNNIAFGVLNHDPRTHSYSSVQEKPDEPI